MDTAVALTQAYLHVNGYFTVTEYPVLEARGTRPVRTVTDLDMLAYRFPHAGHDTADSQARRILGGTGLAIDPVLGCPVDRADMIVGEVKEGTPRLNRAMRDPAVLATALMRFGCCPPDRADVLTREVLRTGSAVTPAGHTIRIVVFGDAEGSATRGPWLVVPMKHVVEYLQDYLSQHWSVLRHAQFSDPAYGVLALIEKWHVEPPAVRHVGKVGT
jgi:hypothetical protein